jgi:hypothetical protein
VAAIAEVLTGGGKVELVAAVGGDEDLDAERPDVWTSDVESQRSGRAR